MPVKWPVHAKDFLSDDPRKKVMPISCDFEEWCAPPCQGRSMSGALDLVRGQALIDIEKQPALLVHLLGVGKPDGQLRTIFMTSFITTPRCSNRRPKCVSDVVATLFPYLASHVKHSLSPEPHALRHLDNPEPACQHHIMLSSVDLFT